LLGRNRSGRLGGPEFILQDFDGGQAVLKADDSSAGNQFQGALIIELCRPTDGHFQAPAWKQNMLRGEEYTGAGDIYCLAVAGFLTRALVQELVTDFPFDGESIGVTPIGSFLVLQTRSHLVRFLTLDLSYRSDKASFSGKGKSNNSERGPFFGQYSGV
jgi:hypothetical protein